MRMLSELIELVLPSSCVCCDRPGVLWCAGCQPDSAPRGADPAPGPAGSVPALPTFAAGEYADELRTALIAYKERGRRQLASPLAGYLADAVDCAVRATGCSPAVLVPIPSSRTAARARGGDHLSRLARAVARQTGLPVLPALMLRGAVADSAGLSADQRRRNLAGRLLARAPADGAGQPIVLDDIVTTGATLAEAGRALAAAGWQPAGAAVVAATRLRRAASHPGAHSTGGRAPPSSM
jgi:predicted amidophosphoribosyltransferase